MPDDKPSDRIEEQPREQPPGSKPIDSPPPPNNPNPPAAQGISRQEVRSEVQNIEDRVKRAERWMIGLTGAIALFALCSVIVGILQWCAMSGQLTEMHNGGIDTHDLAQSTLAASRAWVVVEGTGFGFTKDKKFATAQVVLADSGNSPAFGLDGWRCVEIRSDDPPTQHGQLQKSQTASCLPVNGGTLGRGIPLKMNAFLPARVPANFSRDTDGIGPHFYYWGTVTYDIYPTDGTRHSTSFCLKNGLDQLSACSEGGYEAN